MIDGGAGGPAERAARGSSRPAARVAEPLRDETADLEGTFFAALAGGDGRAAVAALLDLDAAIEGRIRGGEDSPDLDNARSTFRSLIVRLGEAAASGGSDPRATVEPFVEALLAVGRGHARPGTGRPPTWSGTGSSRPGSRSATAPMARVDPSPLADGSPRPGPRTAPRRTSTAAASASSIPAAKIGQGYGPGRPPVR